MGKHFRQSIRWLTTVICSIIIFSSIGWSSTSIAILMSDSLTSSKRTEYGVRKVIKRTYQDVSFRTFMIKREAKKNKATIDSIKSFHPRLLVTIGSPATSTAKVYFSDIPIVFAAVRYPKLSGFVNSISKPGGNITGASLDIPVNIQFKYFKMIIPNLKKVGVIYTEHTASLIPPAKVIAREMGLDLVPVKVNSNKRVSSALDSLSAKVDGLWTVADPQLFDPQTTRFLMLNSLRRGIPLMGFSRYVVESGALFALDFDYKAVGFQAGEIACRILKGESPDRIRVSTADVIWFHYNEKTARHINVIIPEDLVAIAKEVYR